MYRPTELTVNNRGYYMFKKFMLAALLSSAAIGVSAQECFLDTTWDIPTERVDGSALPVAEIKGYVINSRVGTLSFAPYLVEGGNVTSASMPIPCLEGNYALTIATTDSYDRTGPASEEIIAEVGEVITPPPASPNVYVNVSVRCEPAPCNLEIK